MTDFEDGGGQMTANEIVSGADNQIFDDISDVDRASGDLSIRKVYAAVTSADTDKYLDAGVVIFRPPADAATSVASFSTGSFYDERDDLVALLENSISRGVRYNGWLYGTHVAGQRALLLWTRPSITPPSVGARINLIKLVAGAENASEFVWITSVTTERQTKTDANGEYEIQAITCELAYPLENTYTGEEPTRYDPSGIVNGGLAYETRYNPDIVALYGIKPLASAATTGDYSVTVAGGLYTQMIPTGLQETPLADTNPGGDSPALIDGTEVPDPPTRVTFTTTSNLVKPDGALYLGGACSPDTLIVTVSGATLTDQDGVILLGGSTDVGLIDYSQGLCTFNSACPNYSTASKSVSYRPAVRDLRVADTAGLNVTVQNRGYVWIVTLSPIPAPNSLRVSYQVNGAWYVLTEKGSGQLSGADSSYGAGALNYSTGTVTITTGELPDVDSTILFSWTTPVNYISRGGATVNPAKVRGSTAQAQLVPGSVSISWPGVTLTEPVTPDGTLTGTGGSGTVDYATGAWQVIPDSLPAVGTQFTVAYDYSESAEIKSETFNSPPREPNKSIILTLSETNIELQSVRVTIDLQVNAGGAFGWGVPSALREFQVVETDDGAGNLTHSAGTVDYLNGELTLTPDRTVSYPIPSYITTTFP
jgi:hypothetical protein